MCESFGARLRQRREEQGIALSTIAEQTKIKLSLLEALEHDDVSRWPSGIFRRAFVRGYALAIGLPGDDIVREFLDKYPDPLEQVDEIPFAETDASCVSGGPPMRLRYLVGAAVGSLSRLRSGGAQRRPIEAGDPIPVKAVPTLVSGTVEVAATPDTVPDSPVTIDPSEPVTAATAEVSARLENPEAVGLAPQVIAPARPLSEPDLFAVAQLCTELARAEDMRDLEPLLPELARSVDAFGLIVWVWDPQAAALTPALPHGYPDEILAQLPNLPRDARNATAAAFRSGLTCTVSGGDVAASDALVVPLITRAGCAGVLAIELQPGGARRPSTRALATIFAAQMARAVGDVQPAAASRRLA